MRLARRVDVKDPLVKSRGEIVYELIGSPPALGEATGHSLAEITIRPGGSSAGHRHLRSEETYYILRGEGRLVVDGKAHILRPGNACLIKPGEHHQLLNEANGELVLLAVTSPPWVPEDSVFDEQQRS